MQIRKVSAVLATLALSGCIFATPSDELNSQTNSNNATSGPNNETSGSNNETSGSNNGTISPNNVTSGCGLVACPQDACGGWEFDPVSCECKEVEPIGECVSGDGCCPDGCTNESDRDCRDSCGNGVVDPDETCDDNCETCPAETACTEVSSEGSASTCDFKCIIEEIPDCCEPLCPSNQVCAGGTCIDVPPDVCDPSDPGFCPNAFGPGWTCDSNTQACVPPISCTGQPQNFCVTMNGLGSRCENGMCTPGGPPPPACGGDGDCAPWQECDAGVCLEPANCQDTRYEFAYCLKENWTDANAFVCNNQGVCVTSTVMSMTSCGDNLECALWEGCINNYCGRPQTCLAAQSPKAFCQMSTGRANSVCMNNLCT